MFYLLLVAAGLLHAQSFAAGVIPAVFLPYAQLFSLAVLFFGIMRAASRKQAIAFTFIFGLANFCSGIYWLYISMHTYGHMIGALAATAVFLLSFYLCLYPALAAYLYRLLDQRPRFFSAFILAATWALGEWLRATVFTGFPWLNIAYAHVDGPLSAWAPIIGAYGVAYIVALLSALIALTLHHWRLKKQAALYLLCTIGIFVASSLLKPINWSQPINEPISIRLIQGNIDQATKFNPQEMFASMWENFELALLPPSDEQHPPRIVIFPETIIPSFQNRMDPQFWQSVINMAAAQGAEFFIGAPYFAEHNGQPYFANSILAINGNTQVDDLYNASQAIKRYDKQHLVPFGEFIPFGFRWFVEAMSVPLGDFNRGATRQQNFIVEQHVLAPNICYEDIFGNELLPALFPHEGDPGASILFNVSNLAWFGNTYALGQHLQMARMRAQETARPMLRATNTGATAAIDQYGNVVSSLPNAVPGILDVLVQGTEGYTPYARAGNTPILLLIGLILLLSLRRKLFSRHSVVIQQQK